MNVCILKYYYNGVNDMYTFIPYVETEKTEKPYFSIIYICLPNTVFSVFQFFFRGFVFFSFFW